MADRFFRWYHFKRRVMGLTWAAFNAALVLTPTIWVFNNLMHDKSPWIPFGLEVVMGIVTLAWFELGLDWIDDYLARHR